MTEHASLMESETHFYLVSVSFLAAMGACCNGSHMLLVYAAFHLLSFIWAIFRLWRAQHNK